MDLTQFLEQLHEHHRALVDAGLVLGALGLIRKSIVQAAHDVAKAADWTARAISWASKKERQINTQGHWVLNA